MHLGKTVRVYLNGEDLFAGRRIAVNKYNARTFDSALEMVWKSGNCNVEIKMDFNVIPSQKLQN
jgi:hypothetical protein